MEKPIIAFIGAGNMAGSLIGGLIADHYPANKILASNPLLDRLESLQLNFGIETTPNNHVVAEKADVIVLAVKPVNLKSVVTELREILAKKNPLVISIVTGINARTIGEWAENQELGIVRCMPNTPALLRCGITGLYANQFVTDEQRTISESILRAVGLTIWFKKESDLNIVTAVSGSGPAYFFLMMEYMKEYATKMGISAEEAQLLTVNTALGAARMALESEKEISELRKQVTSPGGTTEKAIQVFERGGLRELIEKALDAAHQRAVEMTNLIK